MGRVPVTEPRRLRVRVEGVVQGVGFRPYVHRLATEGGLRGLVGNDADGVFVEVQGDAAAVERFLRRLPAEAPPLAVVERVRAEPVAPVPEGDADPGFRIVGSVAAGRHDALVPPDVATCAACLAEVLAPTGRRAGYAFTNCTHCGPRFTIVVDVPYDRARTTMAGFAMCPACAAEYADPADRRFHAEPTCCPACGPELRLVGADGAEAAPGADPVAAAAALLRAGRIVAVKGLGGYHLAVDAADEAAVGRLRARKQREEKPFALLAADLAAAERLVEVGPEAAAVLTSPAAPVVLLPRRPGAPVAASVAPGNRWLGVMLPSTPLHHLLAAAAPAPLVLTSGNVSDEPIAHRDDDALARLAPIADAFLTHDRPVHVRADDSVVRVVGGRTVPVRRSRGYAPRPLALPWPAPRPVLAVGAELKNTFCLAKGDRALVSQHLGDLGNYETLVAWEAAIAHHQRLFDVAPEVVAHDLHPEYLSTKHALDLPDVERVGVQHHHAHVASCLVDNGEEGPVVGVALDGLGWGTDGTLWGGEVLVADLADAERVARLAPVPQPGGAAAVREPWRMAVAHVLAACGATPPGLAVADRHAADWGAVEQLCRSGLRSLPTSSAGRLFDAVAALVGVRDRVTYEGQAAIELEQLADPDEPGAYVPRIGDGTPAVVDGGDVVRAVLDDLAAGAPAPVVAARFHNGLAAAVAALCDLVRQRTGLGVVALSGGVWQNALLLERAVGALEAGGFRVLTHRQVPPNDGGISLGQAAVAAARDRRAGGRPGGR